MKKIMTLCLILGLATACGTGNQYGECIGFADKKNPRLEYKVSIWNAFWTFVAVETVIAPVLWAVGFVYCPTGYKASEQSSSSDN